MNITFDIVCLKVKEDDDAGESTMVFEYASVGLGRPGLFFYYSNGNSATLGRRDKSIQGKNIFVHHRRPAPERINVLVDMDTNNVMLLAMDEDLEKRMADLFTPAIKINQRCPVWDFVMST